MRKVVIAVFVITLLLESTVLANCSAAPPELEQHIFIHYARGAKPKPPANEEGYYKLLGAKWKTLPITLEVNPSNSYNITENEVLDAIWLAAGEWDNGTYSHWGGVSTTLFSGISINTTISYDDLAWDSSRLDGKNTIVWGDYPTEGVIAVTIIWFNRATKTIVEFDIVLDTNYSWGNATNNDEVMDLQNIVTHELGHGLGLNDLYQSAAYQETMYGYSDYGETIKRDLYKGDKAGITKLYGS